MKKQLFIFLSAVTFGAVAQSGVTNLDFENWVSTPMVCPAGFIGTGVTQQTTGAQHGASYARVTTTVSSGSGATGVMILGSFNGTNFFNGVPYASQPVSISGYYRSNVLNVGDTVGFLFELRNSGTKIASGDFVITSTQSNWTPVTVTLTYNTQINSDTVIFGAVGNPGAIGSHPNAVGSYIDADNFTINTAAGIDPFNANQHIISFPNPATDKVTVSAGKNAVCVKVYDLSGNLIGVHKLSDQKVEIDTHTYENGIYCYSVIDEKNAVLKTSRFVIAK